MDPMTMALIASLALKGTGRLIGGDAGQTLGAGGDLLELGGGEGISPTGGLDLFGEMGGSAPGADAGSGVPWGKLLTLGALQGLGDMGQGDGGPPMQVTSPIGTESAMRRNNPFASMMQPRTLY